ncbi:1-acyl-sn-glycerol-3-phosphate acyltransferase [Saccharibacter sp. 17.LH.SD]|uniref:lysophospholipid acyltransferase family protein n=1 Tax=Saccharibacter sp. 17.LH.SD TaxID=2689393 RepID=UPI001370968B|nr:1-acyl-sn-glycerol-3-phosphate acyltransferase [Saccharibacter sp. 17.LH.SD]
MSLIRGTLFNIYLIILTLIMGIIAFPIRLMKKHDLALRYAQLWSHAVLWGLQHLCSIRITITGKENIPAGPVLIASQHQSFFDGFVWMNTVPLPAYVIKQELTKIPLVGPMLLLSGMIPINRQGGSQALRKMMDTVAHAQTMGRQIILFPEGTRVRPGERVPLQNGIIALTRQAKAPIIPVATNSGLFWPRSPWRKYPGSLIVAIGNPLPPMKGRDLIPALEKAWDDLSNAHHLPRETP